MRGHSFAMPKQILSLVRRTTAYTSLGHCTGASSAATWTSTPRTAADAFSLAKLGNGVEE